MAKYIKRPVVVEAEQWWPGNIVAGVEYEKERVLENVYGVRTIREGAYVTTIHGQRTYLTPGDWVITEPDGIHHYPCKPDVFAATYRRADGTDALAAPPNKEGEGGGMGRGGA